MWRVRKQRLYSFDKSLLSVRKKDKTVIDKVMKSMCLDDISKVLEKPKPVRVIFGIYNGISKREQRAVCIDSCSSKENAYFQRCKGCENLVFQMGPIKANKRATIIESGCRGTITNENTKKFVFLCLLKDCRAVGIVISIS